MWVRSQNKERLINVDTLEIQKVPKDYYNDNYRITGNGLSIGTYTTKAKALKVLDMMQDQINFIKTSELKNITALETRYLYDYRSKKHFKNSFIFEMPQEEELWNYTN